MNRVGTHHLLESLNVGVTHVAVDPSHLLLSPGLNIYLLTESVLSSDARSRWIRRYQVLEMTVFGVAQKPLSKNACIGTP